MSLVRRFALVVIAALAAMLDSSPLLAQLENFAQEGEPPQAGIELLQSEPHDIIRFKMSAVADGPKPYRSMFPGGRCLKILKAICRWRSWVWRDRSFK